MHLSDKYSQIQLAQKATRWRRALNWELQHKAHTVNVFGQKRDGLDHVRNVVFELHGEDEERNFLQRACRPHGEVLPPPRVDGMSS